jgi:hypothetical protein
LTLVGAALLAMDRLACGVTGSNWLVTLLVSVVSLLVVPTVAVKVWVAVVAAGTK